MKMKNAWQQLWCCRPFKAPQKASRGGDGAGKEGGENSQKYATKLQNVQGCKQPGEWWRGIRGGRQG